MTNPIEIDSHGTPIRTEVFYPPAAGNGGAIIIAHGSDGMAEPWASQIRQYAADLADKGFTALIPSYFRKTGSAAGPTVLLQAPANLASWVECVSDTMAYARMLPGISRIGLLGFSLGGHICLLLRGSTTALVEFFAPELRQLGGLGVAGRTTPAVQIHHGLSALLVPFSEAEAIAAQLNRERIAPQVFSYPGATHGFAGSDPNNATARRSSKDRTLAFFEKHLSEAFKKRAAS